MNLSIIIPNYNGKETIQKTVGSIFNSKSITKIHYEIIIVDDCSTDGSPDLIERNYPTVRVIRLKNHSGAAKARNSGIEHAKNNLLLFIDSDIWLNNSSIEELLKHIGNSDIAFPKITYENGHTLYPVMEYEKNYLNISGCFMIKKESLKRLDGNFDEYYETYLEDYDFFIRCKLSGLHAAYAKESVAIHKDKDTKADYSQRAFLELRNILYGRIKLGKHANALGYNPFTMKSFMKNSILTMLNFAWFNWYNYDRSLNRTDKFKLVMKHNNPITRSNVFVRLFIILKAVFAIIKGYGKIRKKRFIIKEQ